LGAESDILDQLDMVTLAGWSPSGERHRLAATLAFSPNAASV
jgi:hypothetical protein